MFVVAGVSGKTGRVVAEALLASGNKIRVLVRDAKKGDTWSKRGAEVAVCSLADADGLATALEGANGFFTLLPEDYSVRDFREHRDAVADALGRAVKNARVPHTVFLSSTAAFLPDGNGPVRSLYRAEQNLRATGARATMIRACYFQENVLSALPAAQGEGILPNFFPSADFAFPTVATRDVGKFAAHCLLEPPAQTEAVDLLGPAYSAREMAELLGRALGKELKVVTIPGAAQVDALSQAGIPRAIAEELAEMFVCFSSGRVSPHGDRTVSASTVLRDTLAERLGKPRGTA